MALRCSQKALLRHARGGHSAGFSLSRCRQSFEQKYLTRKDTAVVHCPAYGLTVREVENIIRVRDLPNQVIFPKVRNFVQRTPALNVAHREYRKIMYGRNYANDELGILPWMSRVSNDFTMLAQDIIYSVHLAKYQVGVALYGSVGMERGLIYCPLQGLIEKPQDTMATQARRRYELLDEQAPLACKAVTGATCALIGETLVQAVTFSHMDPVRLLAFPVIQSMWTASINGPCLQAMERVYPTDGTLGPLVKKAFLGTCLLQPVYVGFFLLMTQALVHSRKEDEHGNGKSCKQNAEQFCERCHGEGKALLAAAVGLMPAVFAVQYTVIPTQLHVLYQCGVSLCWNIFVSNNSRPAAQAVEPSSISKQPLQGLIDVVILADPVELFDEKFPCCSRNSSKISI